MDGEPRLSSALRVFIGLSDISHQDRLNSDLKELQRKRQFVTKKKTAVDGSDWQTLSEKIKNESLGYEEEANIHTSNLLQSAKQIVGQDADKDIIESAGVFLFNLFRNVDKVGHTESSRIRQVFGPFPATAASNACNAVKKLMGNMGAEAIATLGDETREEADGAPTLLEFGQSIKFVHTLQDSMGYVSSSESEDESRKAVNLHYSSAKKMEKKIETADIAHLESKELSEAWLQQEVAKYYGNIGSVELGLSIEDFASTIFDVLTSPKSDSALQNDLFELLGFDRFELIQSLLEHRNKLLSMATRDTETNMSLSRPKVDGASRPTYGCQVIVKSEQEKAMLKQLRKEEKKQEKKGRPDIAEPVGVFNPVDLRSQRETALQSARSTPLLSGRDLHPTRERYPNVYDKLEEARLSSAFIGGTKMLLPQNLSRENNKTYEEVNIPPSDSAPVHVGEQRVRIEHLDEIAQMAFRNTKSLNRIQSVVFETAYKTNENLLICAPTGAGKTNIAMLTILHEIQQHISQGVIKKDEFKIIYVAPMKALAAEMVRNFGGRLEPLGISVRELTGDMSLTKSEIIKTQMLVTTPEKWDVVTRKSTGDVALAQLVRLLIIDEVHLLHDDRGAVIESLVARTLRQVETSQAMIRIIGLSATLPNYLDVARFLHVNPYLGLFFFDGRFRPVPLGMSFVGIKTTSRIQQLQDFNSVCYEKVLYQVKRGYQVMVFVHARNETVRTANVLRDLAKNNGDVMLFLPEQSAQYGDALKSIMKSRNKPLKDLFTDGFSIHHAGMLRQDRNLVEKYFAAGHLKVLVCTATLAWGVNLPAHAVIIKGTQIYDAKKGSLVDLSILDVMQIFGRAGRPQFDTFGHGTIITNHDKLSHYLSLMTRQSPIESQFINSLTDNLNAEIALGTVTNVEEAVKWLSYTYLFVRLTCNPLAYGVPYRSVENDPTLSEYRSELITDAGRKLDKARMVRFDERTGYFAATDQGRIASHFYIKYDTVEVINEHLKTIMTEADILALVSKAQEFDQIKVRDEEMEELERLLHDTCEMQVPGGVENNYGKVNILIQTFVSRQGIDSFSLVSDQNYVAQNGARIMRSLFEICLKKGWPIMASRLLNLSKTLDKRIWGFETPLRQFSILPIEIINKIETKRFSMDKWREMDAKEIGHLIHHVKMGSVVKRCIHQLPCLELEANIQPITRTVLRVRLAITPMFKWDDKVHGSAAESFWIWVEDPDNNHIYHSEYFLLHKKQTYSENEVLSDDPANKGHLCTTATCGILGKWMLFTGGLGLYLKMYSNEPQMLVFTIPIFEPLPSQYYVKAISDRWLGSESMCAISFQHLILPERHPPHTELLDLQPLPLTALMNPMLEALYKFTHFNPIQTQLFHVLYHSDHNVLLGAPTGSGKTIAAELAIFRVFRENPKNKAVYIAPLKALVRERMEDWKVRIEQKLGKKVVELTGDVTPDMRAIARADLIVTTPEKWDGVSRSWQTRSYVKAVSLIVIDEIHLLGNDRGPVLEVIVSRTNFISSHTDRKVRVVGLSTALANARDLADWLAIGQVGLYNFRPSVRPVPLEVHIHGFPGQHYCPRMATMNKPTFQAIKTHSPSKPVLVFVSSRRQTRLTALDLIAFLAGEDNPKQWLHMAETEATRRCCGGMRMWHCRIRLQFYLLLLCLVYFTMLYIFYGRLQLEIGHNPKQSSTSTHKSLARFINLHRDKKAEDKGNDSGADIDIDFKKAMLNLTQKPQIFKYHRSVKGTTEISEVYETQEDNCFISSSYRNRTFQALDPVTYVYSAYLDERLGKKVIRVMAIYNADKKNRALSFYCTFLGSKTSLSFRVKASVYELCENHGKMFGGYLLSCDVPAHAVTVCHINVSLEVTPVHRQYKPQKSSKVTLPVTRLGHKLPTSPPADVVLQTMKNTTQVPLTSNSYSVPYNFTICVPPLFGKIDAIKFVEFIELNRLIGFEHFIFYLGNIENGKIIKLLNYYNDHGIATVIDWDLPSVMHKGKIWYNGQLNAHNDCLYRAMTITRYLAIIDIDEYIVPHSSDMTITNSIQNLISESVGGVSFRSAFYDPKFVSNVAKDGDRSKLLTLAWTARSAIFSNIRTKVLVKPERIFEVGIHHISKPAQEWLKVVKVNTSIAFLHHYRSCVPNYGMKCGSSIQDKTILKYQTSLLRHVARVIKDVLLLNFSAYLLNA